MLHQEDREIDDLRTKYQEAKKDEKNNLKETILKKEHHIRQIYHDVAQLKKEIRNKEIMFINKK